jgi:N-(2-amino-2-carboxyethyl)-L-glutamate synthase
MPVVSRPEEFHVEDLYLDLRPVLGLGLNLKCEGFNFAGSVKLKAATAMVAAAVRSGRVGPGSVLVESSSGNLGLALSMVAAGAGHRFHCVTDVRCNGVAIRAMRALGASVDVIDRADPTRGLLGSRLDRVRELCAADSRHVWLNQYADANNWIAHHRTTAPAIARQFPGLDVLFVGTGTAGTLMGCARYFRELGRDVTVVAVDSAGSVTFGGPPLPRLIPGLGSGVRPPMLDMSYVDDVVIVAEADAVRTCHHMAEHGFLFGGSTGTVVAGAQRWLAAHRRGRDMCAVAISADLGERYLDTIYAAEWVHSAYGDGGPCGALAGECFRQVR